jgi:hypothetical protein
LHRRLACYYPVVFHSKYEEAAMPLFRLFTGDDGRSHVEPISLAKTADWGKGLETTQISFRESPAGNFQDWHPAPRRQFVIILSGQLEIGLGDGSKHIFGPGDARLVEDTTGQGHTTKVHGTQPCMTATIPLKQQ